MRYESLGRVSEAPPVSRPEKDETCTGECDEGGLEVSEEMAHGQEPSHGQSGVGRPDAVCQGQKRRSSEARERDDRREGRVLVGGDADVVMREKAGRQSRDGPPGADDTFRNEVHGIFTVRIGRRAQFGR